MTEPLIRSAVRGRERVLQQARRLFLERGYAEVSMQQIADASGMTKAALYYHFRDKEDLFAQVILVEMRRQRASVEQQIARGGTLRSQVEGLVRLYFDQATPDVLRMMRDFRQHVPEQRHDDVHGELTCFVDTISTIFERAARAGELREVSPRIAAIVFFHTIMAVVGLETHDPLSTPPDAESAARLVCEVVLHGIAAPTSTTIDRAAQA